MTSPFLGPAATPLLMPTQSPYVGPSTQPAFMNAAPTDYGQAPFKTPLFGPSTPAFYAASSPQVTYQTMQVPMQQPFQTAQVPYQIPQTQLPASQTVLVPRTSVQMIPRAPPGPTPDYVVQKNQPVVHSL